MDNNGIIPCRPGERATLRVRSLEPYSSEFTSGQIGVLADIAEQFGSGFVHVTPRQTVEIPHIDRAALEGIMELLNKEGLYTGSSGTYLRNVAACSRWCLYNAIPMSNLAYKLNNLHADVALPGKTNISLSGCDFSCVRSRTSDIGVISRAEIELTDRKCKKCTLCVKEPLGCQVDAIRITDNGVIIDTDKCVRCGFCSNICRPGTISVQFRSFDIFVGGRGGIKPGEAVFYKRIQTEEEVIAEIARILGRYSKKAHEGERIGDMMERLGIKALEE